MRQLLILDPLGWDEEITGEAGINERFKPPGALQLRVRLRNAQVDRKIGIVVGNKVRHSSSKRADCPGSDTEDKTAPAKRLLCGFENVNKGFA
jgi:hypothetical protein